MQLGSQEMRQSQKSMKKYQDNEKQGKSKLQSRISQMKDLFYSNSQLNESNQYFAELRQELQTTAKIIQHYKQQLSKQRQSKGIIGEIDQLQQIFKIKSSQIKELSKEIENTQNNKNDFKSRIISPRIKNNYYQYQASIMTEDIKMQKQQLIKDQLIYLEKNNNYKAKKQTVKLLQEKYLNACKIAGKKPYTFQQFKQRRIRANFKKQQQKYIKKVVSSKNIRNSNKKNTFEDILNNLKYKLQVAKYAVQSVNKKHTQEQNHLIGQISFLINQKESIDSKIMQKEKQLNHMQNKLSQLGSRNLPSMSKITVNPPRSMSSKK